MATHSKFIKDEKLFKVEAGKLSESSTLGANVAAKMNRSTGDLEAINIDETYSALDSFGSHINDNGELWWNDPANQVFGTEKTGGSYPWSIYKQTNIYTTARQYAGKDNQYGVHIFRYPNISSSSTWGGLRIYPPAEAKLSGHKYRFSFDYRGQTGGANLDVYQSYEVGWSNIGIGLPSAWGRSESAFDTDWEWRRYEQEFEIEDSKLNFVPGSNQQAWSSTANYPIGYYGVTYNGYVYRRNGGSDSTAYTIGENPETTYATGNRTVWNGKFPMTAGYFDIYRQIKIGFTYNTQGTRGTHVYIDNIQLTDITTNETFKFNGNGWEADNLSEGTTHIFAKGTAYMGLDAGDGTDKFAVEGSRELLINGASVSTPNSRGLTLVVIDEATGNVDSNTNYDVHGSTAARDSLASALSNIGSNKLWSLTSFDAIGTSPGTALNAQMKAMGSKMLIVDEDITEVTEQYKFVGNLTNSDNYGDGGMWSYAPNSSDGDLASTATQRLFFDNLSIGGNTLESIYFDIRAKGATITIDINAQTHVFEVTGFSRAKSGPSGGTIDRYIADVTRVSATGNGSNVLNTSSYYTATVKFEIKSTVNTEYSVYNNGSYRSTYAAVGRGQQLIKEDGSAQTDTVYKRKGVIDLRV